MLCSASTPALDGGMTEESAPRQAAAEKSVDGSSHPSDAADKAAQRTLSGGPQRSLNRQATVPRKPLDVEKLGDGECAAAGALGGTAAATRARRARILQTPCTRWPAQHARSDQL